MGRIIKGLVGSIGIGLLLGGCGRAVQDVSKNSQNTIIKAHDDSVQTKRGKEVITGNVLENDERSKSGTEELMVVSYTQPTNGQAEYNSDGTFTYRPDVSKDSREDYFFYTVKDSYGNESSAKVIINVISDWKVVPSPTGAVLEGFFSFDSGRMLAIWRSKFGKIWSEYVPGIGWSPPFGFIPIAMSVSVAQKVGGDVIIAYVRGIVDPKDKKTNKQGVYLLRYKKDSGWGELPGTLLRVTDYVLSEPFVISDLSKIFTVTWYEKELSATVTVDQRISFLWGSIVAVDGTAGNAFQISPLTPFQTDYQLWAPRIVEDHNGNMMSVWNADGWLWGSYYKKDAGWKSAQIIEDQTTKRANPYSIENLQIISDLKNGFYVIWGDGGKIWFNQFSVPSDGSNGLWATASNSLIADSAKTVYLSDQGKIISTDSKGNLVVVWVQWETSIVDQNRQSAYVYVNRMVDGVWNKPEKLDQPTMDHDGVSSILDFKKDESGYFRLFWKSDFSNAQEIASGFHRYRIYTNYWTPGSLGDLSSGSWLSNPMLMGQGVGSGGGGLVEAWPVLKTDIQGRTYIFSLMDDVANCGGFKLNALTISPSVIETNLAKQQTFSACAKKYQTTNFVKAIELEDGGLSIYWLHDDGFRSLRNVSYSFYSKEWSSENTVSDEKSDAYVVLAEPYKLARSKVEGATWLSWNGSSYSWNIKELKNGKWNLETIVLGEGFLENVIQQNAPNQSTDKLEVGETILGTRFATIKLGRSIYNYDIPTIFDYR